MEDWKTTGKMNEVYGRYFTVNPPARTTVQISAMPTKGAKVEIDANRGSLSLCSVLHPPQGEGNA